MVILYEAVCAYDSHNAKTRTTIRPYHKSHVALCPYDDDDNATFFERRLLIIDNINTHGKKLIKART